MEERKPNECCNDPANLVEEPTGETHPEGDLILRRCQVCRCRHFELSVDPIEVGIKFS